MTRARLVCRLDGLGDVLLSGPAIRAVAGDADQVTLLCGPAGAAIAPYLPGVDEHLEFACPWILADPPPLRGAPLAMLVADLAARRFDEAVIFTSYHQTPLPLALVLRLAGIEHIGAISDDYPGSLLDIRHRVSDDLHEVERALSLAAAMGHVLPAEDTGHLELKPVAQRSRHPGCIVVHPGATAPARRWSVSGYVDVVGALLRQGWEVVVTGTASERDLAVEVVDRCEGARLAAGTTTLPDLLALIAEATVVVTGNTGPAHLAAALRTPVVSLYAPTVPSVRWRPWRVPHVLLGDQDIECAGCRAVVCPRPGHPCLGSVATGEVVSAVEELAGSSTPRRPHGVLVP